MKRSAAQKHPCDVKKKRKQERNTVLNRCMLVFNKDRPTLPLTRNKRALTDGQLDFDETYFTLPPTKPLPNFPVYEATLLLQSMNASDAARVFDLAHSSARKTLFDDFKSRCAATWFDCMCKHLTFNEASVAHLPVGELTPSKIPAEIWASMFGCLREDITTYLAKTVPPLTIIDMLSGGDSLARKRYDADAKLFQDVVAQDCDFFARYGQSIQVKTWTESILLNTLEKIEDDHDQIHCRVERVTQDVIYVESHDAASHDAAEAERDEFPWNLRAAYGFKRKRVKQRVRCIEAYETESDDKDFWRVSDSNICAPEKDMLAHVRYYAKVEGGRCYELNMYDFRSRCRKSDFLIQLFSGLNAKELARAASKSCLTADSLRAIVPSMWRSQTGWRHSGWEEVDFDVTAAYLMAVVGDYLEVDAVRDLCIDYLINRD